MDPEPRMSGTLELRTTIVRWSVVGCLLLVAATVFILSGVGNGLGALPLLWVPMTVSFIALSAAAVRRVLGELDAVDEDLGSLREAYDRARVSALRDGLTGLGNQSAFMDELEARASLARGDAGPFSLLLIDVDDLKGVNATRGHAAGDEIIRATSRIISGMLRRADRAFRVGGDDFAMVLLGRGPDDAAALARRLLSDALTGGSGTHGVPPFSLTIGVSSMPEPAHDRKQLLHQATAALAWGKRHGRTDVQVFDPARHGIADDWRPLDELAAAVSRVASERLLTPVYQPIHCLRTGAVLGYEGLVRPRADSGFDSATALFVAAESTDRTVELDLASLDAVLTGARTLGRSSYLSVNLSPRSLESDAFSPRELLALARRKGFDARRLVLELTEREAVEDLERLRASLDLLRQAGVRIAADDVGAGNAGLRLLREVDFDIIKIDLSLVQAGAVDDPAEAVLRALRGLARQRGQRIVAEGVETSDQLLAVIELGFDAAQGYLLNRPAETLTAGQVDLARIAFPPEPPFDPVRTPVPATA